MRRLLIAVLLVGPALPAAAGFGSDSAGTSAGRFLALGADARAAAMGGAVAAAADDATALYWNPADLAGLHYRHATFTHVAGYQSTYHDFLAYAQPIEVRRGTGRERDLLPDQLGTVGASVQYFNAGRIPEVDNAGTSTGGSFTPQDLAATVGWGAELARGFDAGVSVKYVSSKIEASAATGAADLGARWRTRIPGTEFDYALSASVRNLGGQLKFAYASDPLPMAVVVGQSLRPTRSLTLDADLTAPRDGSAYASLGIEWRAPMTEGLTAALRAGYDGRVKTGDVGGAAGLCLGGGVGFRRLSFDYAWTPVGELGDAQRLSLSYRF